MATISKIKLANNNIYDIHDNRIDTAEANTIEYIQGTQTTSTSTWTGVTKSNDLYEGKMIVYYLPYAGTDDAATLTLTKPDGTTTSAVNIYRYSTSAAVTTTFAAGSAIMLVYQRNRWNSIAYYNSNTDTKVNQSLSNANTWRGILLTYNTASTPNGHISTASTGVYYTTGIVVNPKDRAIQANTFIGNLQGNADTATSLESAQTINLTGNVTGSADGGTGDGWTINTTVASGVITNAMLAGSISNDKLTNSKITIAGKEVSLGESITLNDLGLGAILRYRGIATVEITDGGTQDPKINGITTTLSTGDVVFYGTDTFVWDGSKWEQLSNSSIYKTIQDTVNSPTASGTATSFIATITQDINGKITATKSNLPVASTSTTGIIQITSGNASAFINTLTIGSTVPTDDSYYIAPGISSGYTETYYRRKMSTLWSYIKNKITESTDLDTKVTQTIQTDDAEYALLAKATTTMATTTATANFTSGITINPSTNTLTAGKISINNSSTSKASLVYNEELNTLNFVFD